MTPSDASAHRWPEPHGVPTTPTAAMPPLELREIRRVDEVESLRGEWEALRVRCPGATPFQSPAWLLPWWRAFGQGTPLVIAMRRAGELVGLAPLYVFRRDASAPRQLFLIGSGNSDHLDVLLAPEIADDGAAALLDHLARGADLFDEIELQQVPTGSALLRALAPPGWSDLVVPHATCPRLALPDTIETLASRAGGELPARLHHLRRRATRAGRLEFATADGPDLEPMLATLQRLHEARWADRGGSSLSGDDVARRFLASAARALLAAGLLRLRELHVGGVVAASLLEVYDRRCAYCYLGTFAPGFAHLSPGTLLIGYAIEEAIGAGAERFDFLRGRERYKYRWGARDVASYRRVLRPPAR